ncbi:MULTISPECIES: HIT domain-containing protein [unclassified Vibrio]|uniref:HIT domain-containing protein n=1 Tax=Vibrio sp. HB236076 TaxID=3232307 RepID=A0AB39HDJ4_9VIBR|nr:HIT domain-containing protein [Vibrio sp. HB161653]MDP5253878.1 HIT domain-containing protein [Vibrio sp. HB161653]
MPEFVLHPQLAKDTTQVGEFPLCLVLLHRDNSVPWLILVPKKADLKEFHHLAMSEQQQFLLESQSVSEFLESQFSPDKINLGALGNMVPQLHYHHIARFVDDLAWPGPLWGNTRGEYRSESAQLELTQRVQKHLNQHPEFSAIQNC